MLYEWMGILFTVFCDFLVVAIILGHNPPGINDRGTFVFNLVTADLMFFNFFAEKLVERVGLSGTILEDFFHYLSIWTYTYTPL